MDVSNLDLNNIPCSVSKERLKKSDRYFHERDKKLCIGVEILLNHALNKIGVNNPIFDTDEHGKPYLKNYSGLYFNLAHSENYVVCAVSDTPVGVDIEYVHDMDMDLAKNYFNGIEYEYILKSQNKNSFFELWVLKESYLKMTGYGFTMDPNEFSIEIGDGIKLMHNKNTCNLGLWNVCDGNYMIGLGSKNKITEPVLINLDDIKDKKEVADYGLLS